MQNELNGEIISTKIHFHAIVYFRQLKVLFKSRCNSTCESSMKCLKFLIRKNNKNIFFVFPFSLILVIEASGLLLPIPLCDARRHLTPQQVDLCLKFQKKHMDLILDARFISEFECEKQFAKRRWNCTLPPPSPVAPLLLPKMPLGMCYYLVCL